MACIYVFPGNFGCGYAFAYVYTAVFIHAVNKSCSTNEVASISRNLVSLKGLSHYNFLERVYLPPLLLWASQTVVIGYLIVLTWPFIT